MKTTKLLTLIAAAGILCACGPRNNSKETTVEPEPVPPIGFRASDYTLESSKVASGETFPKMMRRLGLPEEDIKTLGSRLDTVFYPRKMKAGQNLDAYYTETDSLKRLEYLVYNHNKTSVTVFKCTDSLCLWNYHKPVEHVEKYADVVITSSLWNDTIEAGATPLIVGELSEIFAWTVNFFGLREGDRFQTFYTEQVCEGEVIGVDEVSYSRYTRGKEEIVAIRMDIPGSKDNYYSPDGKNLRKAFLKAPLKYNRVSSRFTYHRKHPVTGKVKPHTGVDYAAPAGTPVHALGDGTVISAGWTTTGGGNVIKIRHNSTYTTGYLHLKGFAKGIKAGARVSQGQVIGYVGSTGVSTGPHLDFRVWKNDTPIDPLSMKSPAAEPVPQKYKPQLDSLAHKYATMLEAQQ